MVHPIDRAVGESVRLYRVMVGLSQEQLAERLGVSFQQVQKYENGVNRISASTLYRITLILGVPVEALFEFAEWRNVPPQMFEKETLVLLREFARVGDKKTRANIVRFVKSLEGAAASKPKATGYRARRERGNVIRLPCRQLPS